VKLGVSSVVLCVTKNLYKTITQSCTEKTQRTTEKIIIAIKKITVQTIFYHKVPQRLFTKAHEDAVRHYLSVEITLRRKWQAVGLPPDEAAFLRNAGGRWKFIFSTERRIPNGMQKNHTEPKKSKKIKVQTRYLQKKLYLCISLNFNRVNGGNFR